MNSFTSLLIFVSLYANVSNAIDSQKLQLVYSWKSLDFSFPSEEARQYAIRNEIFVPGAPVPIDVDIARVSSRVTKLFVTIPRFQKGVPATLGTVSRKLNSDGDPIINPYPNWEWNALGNCDHITSVYRVKVDECGRLWVVDTGKLVDDQICPPQLLVFDVMTDQLISRYQFPSDQLLGDSLLITPVVDVRDQCSDAFVYIADVQRFQLIVYDHKNLRSWNIQNNLFYPYPPNGNFTINGESFDLMDGLFGLALGPVDSNGDRMLYFHSLASVVESSVPTSVIRNYSIFRRNPTAMRDAFQPFQNVRPSQSAAEAMNSKGILFYGLMSETAIGCWNSVVYPEFGGNNLDVIVTNPETLQFASGMKIFNPPNEVDELWVITVSFQKVMTGTLDPQQTNFRIQAGFVNELIFGTKCSPDSRSYIPGFSNNKKSYPTHQPNYNWHHHH